MTPLFTLLFIASVTPTPDPTPPPPPPPPLHYSLTPLALIFNIRFVSPTTFFHITPHYCPTPSLLSDLLMGFPFLPDFCQEYFLDLMSTFPGDRTFFTTPSRSVSMDIESHIVKYVCKIHFW